MPFCKEIDNKGAVLEWSPISTQPNLVALGTKDSSGMGFDEYGGELEIHQFDLADQSSSTTLIGKAKTSSRFSSIAWSKMSLYRESFPLGIVAGGMADGLLHFWNPDKINSEDPDETIATVEQHQGNINALQFNPHNDSSHLLASGGNDGEIYISSLEHPESPEIFSPVAPTPAKHSAAVTKCAWNSHVPHILASASQNGSTIIWDLKQKKAWCELRDPAGAPISDICWNPDQGLHIMTASGDDRNPVIKIFDLRSSTSIPLATLQGHTERVFSMSWCPFDSSLLMSCGKDNKTFIWDLFTAQPIYTLPNSLSSTSSSSSSSSLNQSAASSFSNPSSVVSSFGGIGAGGFGGGGFGTGGFGANPFGSSSDASALFGGGSSGGGLASSQNRYHVSWSPCLPGLAATCSFDRKVQFSSLSGFKSTIGKAPKWLKRPSGSAFGFGGKFVSFHALQTASHPDSRKGAPPNAMRESPLLTLSQVQDMPDIVKACEEFQATLRGGDHRSFCEYRASQAANEQDQRVWNLMKVLCFEKNARQGLLLNFGFDPALVAKLTEEYAKKSEKVETDIVPPLPPPSTASTTTTTTTTTSIKSALSSPGLGSASDFFGASSSTSAEDVFGGTGPSSLPTPPTSPSFASFSSPPIQVHSSSSSPPTTIASPSVSSLSPLAYAATAEMVMAAMKGEEAEPIIRQAIIVGNFSAAVDCCLEAGLLAEALLLAQCGEPPLWAKTQAAFFQRQKSKYPFLNILNSVIKNDLNDYVHQSDLTNWKETLALLITYASSESFPALCETLAARLHLEANQHHAATLCYMCALNISKTIEFWMEELRAENTQLGRTNIASLHQFVEKVTIFMIPAPKDTKLSPECLSYFSEYASLLASQGQLEAASQFLRGSDQILLDRIFHSAPRTQAQGKTVPAFPFNKVNVTVSSPSPSPQQAATVPTHAKNIISGGHAQYQQQQSQPQPQQQQVKSQPHFQQQQQPQPGYQHFQQPQQTQPQPTTFQQQPQQQQPTIFQPQQPSQFPQQTTHQSQPQQQFQQSQSQPQSQPKPQPQVRKPTVPSHLSVNPMLNVNPSPAPTSQHTPTTPTQSSFTPPAPLAAPQTPQLPPGWMQLLDPATNRHFYVNQTTGQSSWEPPTFTPAPEPPVPAPVPTPSPVPSSAPSSFHQPQPQRSNPVPSPSPMSAPAPTPTPSPAPFSVVPSGPFPDQEAVETLGHIIGQLSATANATDKRQLVMVSGAYSQLVEMQRRGEINQDVATSIQTLVTELQNRNFVGANNVQTHLANSVWNQHKDWLKGTKLLIQLASKKI